MIRIISIARNSKNSEKTLERILRDRVKTSGGLALKFTPMGFAGMPDRIILLPGGRAAFAELKSTGEKPKPVQVSRIEWLRRLGFKVAVIDSFDNLNQFLEEISR